MVSASADECALNLCGNAVEMFTGGVVIRAIGESIAEIAERDTAVLLLQLIVDGGAGESASQ